MSLFDHRCMRVVLPHKRVLSHPNNKLHPNLREQRNLHRLSNPAPHHEDFRSTDHGMSGREWRCLNYNEKSTSIGSSTEKKTQNLPILLLETKPPTYLLNTPSRPNKAFTVFCSSHKKTHVSEYPYHISFVLYTHQTNSFLTDCEPNFPLP